MSSNPADQVVSEASSQASGQAAEVVETFTLTNIILVILITYLLYKLFGNNFGKRKDDEDGERFIVPDPLPKHDMTLDELRMYDGKGPEKRVCIGILGKVYDCTKSYKFYGPEGPYRNFAGHDATRAFAKFDVMAVKDDWDDVSDLSPSEMSSVEEWKAQFEEKYDLVGRLVRSKDEIIETVDDGILQAEAKQEQQNSESSDGDVEVIDEKDVEDHQQ